jgi:hypothetical protein
VTGWALGKCNGVVLCLTSTPFCFLSGSIHATGNGHTTCIGEVEGRLQAKRREAGVTYSTVQYTIIRPCYCISGSSRLARSCQPAGTEKSTRDADEWEPKRASGLCIILTQQVSYRSKQLRHGRGKMNTVRMPVSPSRSHLLSSHPHSSARTRSYRMGAGLFAMREERHV